MCDLTEHVFDEGCRRCFPSGARARNRPCPSSMLGSTRTQCWTQRAVCRVHAQAKEQSSVHGDLEDTTAGFSRATWPPEAIKGKAWTFGSGPRALHTAQLGTRAGRSEVAEVRAGRCSAVHRGCYDHEKCRAMAGVALAIERF